MIFEQLQCKHRLFVSAPFGASAAELIAGLEGAATLLRSRFRKHGWLPQFGTAAPFRGFGTRMGDGRIHVLFASISRSWGLWTRQLWAPILQPATGVCRSSLGEEQASTTRGDARKSEENPRRR